MTTPPDYFNHLAITAFMNQEKLRSIQ